MKSSIDILSELHKVLFVDPLKSALTGEILIGDIAGGDEDREHVTLNCLTNSNEYLQNGIINLNIYVPQLKSGRANNKRFKELIDLVKPLVEEVTTANIHFQIVDDKGIMKDQDRDYMYFNNIRLEFQTLKNS